MCVTERVYAVNNELMGAVSWCGHEFVSAVGRLRGNERCTCYP